MRQRLPTACTIWFSHVLWYTKTSIHILLEKHSSIYPQCKPTDTPRIAPLSQPFFNAHKHTGSALPSAGPTVTHARRRKHTRRGRTPKSSCVAKPASPSFPALAMNDVAPGSTFASRSPPCTRALLWLARDRRGIAASHQHGAGRVERAPQRLRHARQRCGSCPLQRQLCDPVVRHITHTAAWRAQSGASTHRRAELDGHRWEEGPDQSHGVDALPAEGAYHTIVPLSKTSYYTKPPPSGPPFLRSAGSGSSEGTVRKEENRGAKKLRSNDKIKTGNELGRKLKKARAEKGRLAAGA